MTTNIRKAIPDDLERIVEMGLRFAAESSYSDHIKLSPAKISEAVVKLMTNPSGIVFVSEAGGQVTGMIGMLVFEHPYSGVSTASEAFWWVDPESRGIGLKLLRTAETWAREHDAKVLQMVAPDEKIGALYERLGFSLVESSYQRGL